MFFQNDTDSKTSQTAAVRVEEQGRGPGRRKAALLDQRLQKARGFRPKRTSPFLAAFSPKQDAEGSVETKIVGLQADDFADTRTDVEHQT